MSKYQPASKDVRLVWAYAPYYTPVSEKNKLHINIKTPELYIIISLLCRRCSPIYCGLGCKIAAGDTIVCNPLAVTVMLLHGWGVAIRNFGFVV